ncbi:pre-60S ribosomal particles component [Sporothrix stenoceras]|uniref:Pre-60S ribosomal particles component n=1 Tax=Sporothrix stenoceras TaxID=5173 RepID=A0ABR3ZQQ4_9PEZI
MSAISRKRRGDEASASRPKNDRFQKKRKRAQQMAYHSDSDSIEGGSDDEEPKTADLVDEEEDGSDDGFQAVDLLDSDDENLDALADDGATSDEDENDEVDLEGIESGDDDENDHNDDEDSLDSLSDNGKKQKQNKTKPAQRVPAARDAPTDSEGDDDEEDDDAYNSGGDSDNGAGAAPKSKRNDPATFATSLSKILGTKLSTTRRADPVLARSADAREASRRVVDAGLEEKARRQMRLEKRAALERGRVKDVLIATARPVSDSVTAGDAAGELNVGETTTTILATERRLRKVAQRGVVQLFNAVRAAQVKAAQAKKQAKAEGLIGMDKREAKVTEMSRKGFLDLIASGGGELKKGGLEEA